MCRKNIAAVLALFVLTLGGCSFNSAEGNEQVSEIISAAAVAAVSQRAETESTSAETTSVTSETVIFCDESVFEETSAEIEAKTKGIKVTPANEVYNVYPKRITYPEKTATEITAEKAEIKEEFKKDGYTVDEFRAVYPVFSGGDKAVMKKINDSLRTYIDEAYEKSKKHTEEYDFEMDCGYVTSGFGFSMSICGNSRNNTELTYDINGNILSVDFYTHDYAGGAHGAVRPVSFVFDLRTGERIDFNNIFEDKNAVVNEINMAAYQYFERIWSIYGVDRYESEFEKFYGKLNTDDLDRESITVRDGCLSYCTVPYEFGGSFADGMQFMDVAMEDIYPYLNEAGRSLFEGYTSAKSEPANIVEEYGEKYFDLD